MPRAVSLTVNRAQLLQLPDVFDVDLAALIVTVTPRDEPDLINEIGWKVGRGGRIRTLGPRFWRPML